jgi:hypothetical protein
MALLQEHTRDGRGDSEAQVDNGVDLQFGRGPAGDHLLQAELDRFDVVEVAMHLPGQGRVVDGLGGLHLVGGDDDGVDQDPGDMYGLGRQLNLREPFDLSDDDAVIVVGGVGLVEGTQRAALLLVGEVAVQVGSRGADDRNIDLDRRIEQVVVAADLHQLDEVVGNGVHLRPLQPRIGVRAKADLGQHSRLPGGGGPVHLEQHSRRDVESLNLITVDQLADQRRVQLGAAGRIGAGEHAA